jgi:hypothetical protein
MATVAKKFRAAPSSRKSAPKKFLAKKQTSRKRPAAARKRRPAFSFDFLSRQDAAEVHAVALAAARSILR